MVMKKKLLILLTVGGAFVGCTNYDEFMAEMDTSATNQNATKIFGTIDPNQDWNSVVDGSVSVTADAPFADIVKVQILTESPIFNANARVLSEAKVSKGQTVTLDFEAPNANDQLVAACVNSQGNYYVQVFDVNAGSVHFANATRSARKATASEVPTFTSLKLKSTGKSLNALRADASKEGSCTISSVVYTEWANSNWSDEMWELDDANTFDNGWTMDSEKNHGHVFRTLDGFAEGEQANVESIIKQAIYKFDESGKNKRNNLASVRYGAVFMTSNNYVYTDGETPVTLIPIQIFTTEFKMNNIYYYYFKPEDIPAGMSETDYVKTLPKFKAIRVMRVSTTPESNNGTFYRRQEFLLPYYKNAPQKGENEASAIFPKGYKIGFLNAKYTVGKNTEWNNKQHGCTYGDGALNYAVNHLKDHFLSAMDKSLGGKMTNGMNFTDPRIAMFAANGKTYMCFEEGSDCNFSDMVIEIGGGIDLIEETPETEEIAYTMCFEDRPNSADYDLNDVVLRCSRKNETTLTLSLIATGANDKVYIHGAEGWAYNDQEVHEIFGLTDADNSFVNTQKDGQTLDAKSADVTVGAGVKIRDYLKNIYIENRSTGKTIRLAKKGEPPFGIIIPQDFDYPLENQPVTKAYTEFLKWAQNCNESKDWYSHEDATKIFPSLFKTQEE